MEKPARIVFCKVCGKTGPAWQFAPIPEKEGEGHLCEEHSIEANQRRQSIKRLGLEVIHAEVSNKLLESRAKGQHPKAKTK